MPTGTIKFFNRKKGFGFIIVDESQKEIFFHATGVADKNSIKENDRVSFEEKEGDRGIAAVNVVKL
ncbi:MAG: cold-shock protein [Bacteroidota bacterium]